MLNQGLMLISPIILVRLITVEQFGHYREFLLYAGVLSTICAFGINNSLLYFIPSRPGSLRQMIKQSVTLTVVSSVLVLGVTLLANALTHGAVLGDVALPVALYVMLFVNLDFWEFYWLSRRRTLPVLAYTSGRLIARILVVIIAATLTRDVYAIIWSLVVLEAVRFVASLAAMRNLAQEPELAESCWREQLKYCVPVGVALILVTLNKSLGNLFVAKAIGAVALAHYTIGTHIQPVITVLRNSVSDALLPDLAALKSGVAENALALWRRSTVVSMVLLMPAGVALAEFAEPIVLTLFSPDYAAAIPIFQIYLLVLLREVFDFGVALRALNRNAPIVHANLLAIVLNIGLLVIAIPLWGLPGAALAYVVSRFAEGAYMALRVKHVYGVKLRALANWSDLGRVAVAGVIAAGVFYGSFWLDHFGVAGIVLGSLAYLGVFLLALLACRLPMMTLLMRRGMNKSLPA